MTGSSPTITPASCSVIRKYSCWKILTASIASELTLSLPARQAFKINVCFDMMDQDKTLGNGEETRFGPAEGDEPSDSDVAVVRELHADLALESRPFDAMADRLGMDVAEFLRKAASFKERGIMRRYGARLDHYRSGFVSNALSCWKVEPARVAAVGKNQIRRDSSRLGHG